MGYDIKLIVENEEKGIYKTFWAFPNVQSGFIPTHGKKLIYDGFMCVREASDERLDDEIKIIELEEAISYLKGILDIYKYKMEQGDKK